MIVPDNDTQPYRPPQQEFLMGLLFKLLSPIAITVIGWLGLQYLEDISTQINELKSDIKEVKQGKIESDNKNIRLELKLENLEKRVDWLEGKGRLLENPLSIMFTKPKNIDYSSITS